jgi:perosamine synthetase
MTEFKKTSAFENMIAEYTGVRHCIVTNNGTVSLTLAAMACGISPGDEVIVPNYTMIATPNSIRMIGAVPVFADVEPETLCIDMNHVNRVLTKRTRAMILVSANGRYPKSGIEVVVNYCKEKNLILIEDSAQAFGSFYSDGTHMGSKGLVGSFSFSAPKIISTGQGGALITNDDQIANRIRMLKDFGRTHDGMDIHDSIGFNFKFTDIQAVIGIVQMGKLAYRTKRKKQIYSSYESYLGTVDQVRFFDQDLRHITPWFVDVLVENREALQNYLKENGMGSRVMYPPINKQKAYNLPGEYPVSNLVGEMGLWLPSASQLSEQNIKYICSVVKKFYNSPSV